MLSHNNWGGRTKEIVKSENYRVILFGLFRFLYILQNGDGVYSEIGFIAVECGAGIK